jgi:hypothetical protein
MRTVGLDLACERAAFARDFRLWNGSRSFATVAPCEASIDALNQTEARN